MDDKILVGNFVKVTEKELPTSGFFLAKYCDGKYKICSLNKNGIPELNNGLIIRTPIVEWAEIKYGWEEN